MLIEDLDKQGDVGIGEATNEVYLREGVTKKDYSEPKNSQSKY